MTPTQPTATTTEFNRYHFCDDKPIYVKDANGEWHHIGAGWLAITEAEYGALSTAPSGDGEPGMVLDPATVEACAKVADEKGFAVADTNADRYWQSVRISRAIRALAASSGETKP